MEGGRRLRDQQVEEYFDAKAPSLRRTAYFVVRDWHTAEDMVQSAFVKLYVAWPRIRRDSLDGYARRTVVNVCLSHLRKHRRELVREAIPEDVINDPETPFELGSALAMLPPKQRAIVALRYLDDLSIDQVADIMNVAPGTVKSQTFRALANLRKVLPDLPVDQEALR